MDRGEYKNVNRIRVYVAGGKRLKESRVRRVEERISRRKARRLYEH
jgi:hypothetical protein